MLKFKKLDFMISKMNSIYENIAVERFLYKNRVCKNPLLLFYQNKKSVIIGKNQNSWKECKIEQIKKDNVELCRRFSGGGAVYQDMGNLCFSFISPVPPNVLPFDTKKFHFDVLIKALNNIGLNTECQGRNDMTIDGKKFSGSAFEIDLGGKTKQPKVLHHGTLLLNTNLNEMMNYLNPNIHKLQSKGVDSVKQRVINLQEISKDINAQKIIDSTKNIFYQEFGDNAEQNIQYLDHSFIENNLEAKNYYKTLINEDWILGESGFFTNQFETRFDWGIIDVNLEVKKGKIIKAVINSDSLFPDMIDTFQNILNQNQYYYSSVAIEDYKNELLKNINNIQQQEMIYQYINWLKICIKGEQLIFLQQSFFQILQCKINIKTNLQCINI